MPMCMTVMILRTERRLDSHIDHRATCCCRQPKQALERTDCFERLLQRLALTIVTGLVLEPDQVVERRLETDLDLSPGNRHPQLGDSMFVGSMRPVCHRKTGAGHQQPSVQQAFHQTSVTEQAATPPPI
ncbi:hypothetical protein SDC9_133723 [bioreactor metagenome]|uniref:Uncharacterized protein n=1 Tax=bioreactor metagenome TaxID=1076179 RepID=A0A645DCH9_9ZZZZ